MSWRNAYRVGQRLIVGAGFVTVVSTKDNYYPWLCDLSQKNSVSWKQALCVRAEETETVPETPVAAATEDVAEIKESPKPEEVVATPVDPEPVTPAAAEPPVVDATPAEPSEAEAVPAAEAPAAEIPAADPPAADLPAEEEPVADAPVADPPAAEAAPVEQPKSDPPTAVPVTPTILGQSYTTVATVSLASIVLILIALGRN